MKFYLLSFLSGIFEIGCICWGYNQGFSLLETLILGCAYQFGNTFPRPHNMSKVQYIESGVIGLLACFGSFALNDKISYLCMVIAIISCSICMQTSRSVSKGKGVNTTIKRMIRIVGFGISIWSVNYYKVIIMAILVISLGIIGKNEIPAVHRKKISSHNLYIVMVLHQMHYFVYVYGVLFYVIKQKGIELA